MEQEKRPGGAIIEDKDGKKIWLVLIESTGKEGVGFKHDCGETIMGARVAHPIWDGPFACSGSGAVHTKIVPYCPKCEIEPNFQGAPIDIPFPGIAVKR